MTELIESIGESYQIFFAFFPFSPVYVLIFLISQLMPNRFWLAGLAGVFFALYVFAVWNIRHVPLEHQGAGYALEPLIYTQAFVAAFTGLAVRFLTLWLRRKGVHKSLRLLAVAAGLISIPLLVHFPGGYVMLPMLTATRLKPW